MGLGARSPRHPRRAGPARGIPTPHMPHLVCRLWPSQRTLSGASARRSAPCRQQDTASARSPGPESEPSADVAPTTTLHEWTNPRRRGVSTRRHRSGSPPRADSTPPTAQVCSAPSRRSRSTGSPAWPPRFSTPGREGPDRTPDLAGGKPLPRDDRYGAAGRDVRRDPRQPRPGRLPRPHRRTRRLGRVPRPPPERPDHRRVRCRRQPATGQRRASPVRERPGEVPRVDEPRETQRVDGVSGHLKPVGGADRGDRRGAERAPQAGDVRMQGPLGGARPVRSPHEVDEPRHGQCRSRRQRERGEQCLTAAWAHVHRLAVTGLGAHAAQQADAETGPLAPP